MTCTAVKDMSPSPSGDNAVHVKRRRSRIVPQGHGAKSANLPVQVPVKLAVNVKTAKGAFRETFTDRAIARLDRWVSF